MREVFTYEKLQEVVFQSIGHASMCWNQLPKGVFNDKKATELGFDILEAIRKYIKELENETK